MAWKPFGINIGLMDVLSPATGIFKAVTKRDIFSNKDKAADEYVLTRMLSPLSFSGGYADLQARISSEIDSCDSYVRKKGVLVSGSRETCSNKIQAAYSDVIADRQSEEYKNDQLATAQFFQGNNTVYLIAFVVIVLIIIIIYF